MSKEEMFVRSAYERVKKKCLSGVLMKEVFCTFLIMRMKK